MNKKIILWCLIVLCIPIVSFSQSGKWNTVIQQLTQPKSNSHTTTQDTTKPKQTGTQSNLAVSDEGTPSSSTKADSQQNSGNTGNSGQAEKKSSGNPIENMKKKLTKVATQNNNNSGTKSNLAVTDEGTPSDKGANGKTNRDATGTSTSPNQGNSTTVSSPK